MSFFLVWDLCIEKPYRMSKKSTEKPQDECPGIGGCITFLRCPARSWQWKILRRNDPPITALSILLAVWLIWQTNFEHFWHRKCHFLAWVFAWKMGFLLAEIEISFFGQFVCNFHCWFRLLRCGYGKMENREWISSWIPDIE